MLERLKDVLRNRKDNDQGFSLVELAVVIVVIGILVAIAVPVFLGIQDSAKQANVDAVAANASAIAAGTYAGGDAWADADFTSLIDGETIEAGGITNSGTDTLEGYCVSVVASDGKTGEKGPGC